MTFEFGKNGAPPEATYEAFGDWLYGQVHEGDTLARASLVATYAKGWWQSRRKEEEAYGPVTWNVPQVDIQVTPGSVDYRVNYTLLFPPSPQEVYIKLVTPDTVDGTAELEGEDADA